MAGALFAAFMLLPEIGLKNTIWFAAGINALVFLLAAALGQRVSPRAPPKDNALDAPGSAPPPPRARTFSRFPAPGWVLPLMLLAGAVAFFQEVLWTRMLSHVVGSSIYAFGVMVASFLTGIAIGGGIGAALARTRKRAAQALGAALFLAAAAAAFAYLQLESLLPERAGLLQNTQAFGPLDLPVNTLFAALLLLPMTIAIGMTYPLAVRVLASDAERCGTGQRSRVRVEHGRRHRGFAGRRLRVDSNAEVRRLHLRGRCRERRARHRGTLGAGANQSHLRRPASAVAIVGCVLFAPAGADETAGDLAAERGHEGPRALLRHRSQRERGMVTQDGGLALRTNGLPEALMDTPGSAPRFSGEFWLSPLAVIARPETRDMLVVGFGGGVVIEGAPPSVRNIDIIELEPKVIEANRHIAACVGAIRSTIRGSNVILNDARGALRLTSREYDAIVSQPSHPWTAGASHLYTREFMELARDHLNPRGVFVQWMNVMFLDED